MSAAVLAQIQHLTVEPWASHPSARPRRRRRSVADLLHMSTSDIQGAARRVADEQARRGVRTIDTATMPGASGGA